VKPVDPSEVRFCQALIGAPLDQYVELARAAEAAGFDAVAVSDHLFHPDSIASPYPYTDDGRPRYAPGTEFPDTWGAICAMASVTTTLEFYSNVYVLPSHSPLEAAKAIATAAAISGGRVHAGVAAGWMREEYEALGRDFARRGAALDEAIAVLRQAWSGDGTVDHHGAFVDAGPARMTPVPPSPVPILAGGHGAPALRRAAQLCDGWLGMDYRISEIPGYLGRLDELRAGAGRDAEPFQVVLSVLARPTPDKVAAVADLGVSTIVTSAWVAAGTDPSDRAANLRAIESYGRQHIEPLRR
jgi:probable F420-dependent oxidoreductase